MNADLQKTITTAATNALLDVLDEQPWYRRYAGTLTTAAGAVVTLGTWALTTELGLPRWAQLILGVAVAVAGTVAARATRNGTTPRGSQVLLDSVVEKVTAAVTPGDGSLDQLVADRAAEAATSVTERATRAAVDVINGGIGAVGTVPGLGGVAAAAQGYVSEAERAFLGRGRP